LFCWIQVEDNKLKDSGGDYETFLEKNEVEATAMAEKEGKLKEQQKSQIKSKNKVR
jgi:hypothetical protein